MTYASLISLLIISFGVASDAFAMTVSNVLEYGNLGKKKWLLPLIYALFQAIMPLIGCLLGEVFDQHIEQFAHWVALILLSLLGFKTIIQTYQANHENKNDINDCCQESCAVDLQPKQLTLPLIITQAIATSIDAMIVGLSIAVVSDVNILLSVSIIFAVTFITCAIGLFVGRLGKFCQGYAGYLGGLILILMGFKIFVEHILG